MDNVITTGPYTAQWLIDSGILWAINRTLFHPRGFALAVDPNDETFYLWGNGDEPWQYEGDEDDKFYAFNSVLDAVTAVDEEPDELDVPSEPVDS